ncbi:MAG: hypothetical protein IH840_06675 [Candidatus Heimdallarchaeota archaeon]|nr:hypothetical protein [Candidatus Heimdallarchaeota archaeon]
MVLKYFVSNRDMQTIGKIMSELDFISGQNEVEEYETRKTYMKLMINVFKWESCAQILSYLTIYGRMSAKELNELIGLRGEKSIFRSIKLLLDARFITKETLTNRKRNARYLVLNTVISDPDFDEGFVKYLMKKKELYLLGDYLSATNKSSMAFMKTITQIISQQLDKSVNPKNVTQFSKNSFFYEVIYPNEVAPELSTKLKQLIKQELGSKLKNLEIDLSKPMDNPSALYIAYMPLNTGSN